MKETKFIADVMLGKLSKLLRILGFDTLYYRDKGHDKLLELAVKENRQILTRKTSLRNHKDIKNQLLFIKENDPVKQLREVIRHYNLKIQPQNVFALCLICNQKLKEISTELVKGRVPDYVANTQKAFSTCPHCKRIFWKGTHYENMWRRIEETINIQQ
jgi:uncharacterized protein with PIN domain